MNNQRRFSITKEFAVILLVPQPTCRVEHQQGIRENTKIKPADFFDHTIGITYTRGPVQDIVLWFTPATAPYIKTQHLHHSQQIIEDTAKGLTVKLKLRVNYELTALLLIFVPNIVILEPLSLRKSFYDILHKGVDGHREHDSLRPSL
ncbi:WYL domain-containing protein [Pseudochryseolinea flava]|uniref:WYL domain-containing protein n=1 Tax=Pseudochryseolinea flava TaxID=2059302 RepID=UPI00140220FC|nr:WYL domain-containing protein [Pseudochryseolinea flava]